MVLDSFLYHRLTGVRKNIASFGENVHLVLKPWISGILQQFVRTYDSSVEGTHLFVEVFHCLRTEMKVANMFHLAWEIGRLR